MISRNVVLSLLSEFLLLTLLHHSFLENLLSLFRSNPELFSSTVVLSVKFILEVISWHSSQMGQVVSHRWEDTTTTGKQNSLLWPLFSYISVNIKPNLPHMEDNPSDSMVKIFSVTQFRDGQQLASSPGPQALLVPPSRGRLLASISTKLGPS